MASTMRNSHEPSRIELNSKRQEGGKEGRKEGRKKGR
jgi:hypothetical protein